MNSRCKNHQNRNLCALGGPNTEDQFNVLQRMLYFLKKFHVLHTKTGAIRKLPLPWEHGMRCSIKSTKSLYNDLVVNGPFEFLMTAKLNQDCLENLFSRIRGKGLGASGMKYLLDLMIFLTYSKVASSSTPRLVAHLGK